MRTFIFIAAAALAGCATTYDLTVMPRDSGKTYAGVAEDTASGQGRISITIEGKTYDGSWVETQPSQATGYVTGGFGWGWGWRRGGMGSLGTFVTIDNPQ